MFFESRTEDLYISKFHAPKFPLHLHHNMELAICISGTAKVSCGGEVKELKCGDIMVSFPHDLHEYICSEDGIGYMLIFNHNISDILLNRLTGITYENYCSDKALIPFFEGLYNEFKADQSFEIMYGYLHLIIGSVLKNLHHFEHKQPIEYDLFTKAVKYVSENYTSPLSLKSVAEKIGVDQCHLSRVFSKKVPNGFYGYLQQLRIEHAKNMLKNTCAGMYEIAVESGFSSQRTFNRVFKNETALTPKEFRQNSL